MILIKLDIGDQGLAMTIGWAKRLVGQSKRGTYGIDNTAPLLGQDIRSAAAEIAVAKHFNMYWNGALNVFTAADAGPLQVRSTIHRDGCLLLHDRDNPDDVFVLVVTDLYPTMKLVGWIRAEEGQVPGYWKDKGNGRPCYYVPQDALRDMDLLSVRERGASCVS